MDPRLPPLSPPEPTARTLTLPMPPLAAFPLAEWAVFAAILSLLLRA